MTVSIPDYTKLIIEDYSSVRTIQVDSKSNKIDACAQEHLKSDNNTSSKKIEKKYKKNEKIFKIKFYTSTQLCTSIKNSAKIYLEIGPTESEGSFESYSPSFLAEALFQTRVSDLEKKFQWGTIALFIDALIKQQCLFEARSLMNILHETEILDNVNIKKNLTNFKEADLPKLKECFGHAQKQKNKNIKNLHNSMFVQVSNKN